MNGSALPVDTVLKRLDTISASSFITDGDQNKALIAAYTLVGRLESPWETIVRLYMAQASSHSSYSLLREAMIGIFEARCGGQPEGGQGPAIVRKVT